MSEETSQQKETKIANGTTMVGDEAELARMGYKQELKCVPIAN